MEQEHQAHFSCDRTKGVWRALGICDKIAQLINVDRSGRGDQKGWTSPITWCRINRANLNWWLVYGVGAPVTCSSRKYSKTSNISLAHCSFNNKLGSYDEGSKTEMLDPKFFKPIGFNYLEIEKPNWNQPKMDCPPLVEQAVQIIRVIMVQRWLAWLLHPDSWRMLNFAGGDLFSVFLYLTRLTFLWIIDGTNSCLTV